MSNENIQNISHASGFLPSAVVGNAFLTAENEATAKQIFASLNRNLSATTFNLQNFQCLESENRYACPFKAEGEKEYKNNIKNFPTKCKEDPVLGVAYWDIELNFMETAFEGDVISISRYELLHKENSPVEETKFGRVSELSVDIFPNGQENDIQSEFEKAIAKDLLEDEGIEKDISYEEMSDLRA